MRAPCFDQFIASATTTMHGDCFHLHTHVHDLATMHKCVHVHSRVCSLLHRFPFCPRTSLVYPPEVSFLLKFLKADEHATIVTRDLYEPSDSARAGSVDKDPNMWDWISDKWNTEASAAPEGTSLNVAHDLLLNKQLVFLNVSGLSNADGDEVLRNLPAKLR